MRGQHGWCNPRLPDLSCCTADSVLYVGWAAPRRLPRQAGASYGLAWLTKAPLLAWSAPADRNVTPPPKAGRQQRRASRTQHASRRLQPPLPPPPPRSAPNTQQPTHVMQMRACPLYLMSTILMTDAFPMRCRATMESPLAQ